MLCPDPRHNDSAEALYRLTGPEGLSALPPHDTRARTYHSVDIEDLTWGVRGKRWNQSSLSHSLTHSVCFCVCVCGSMPLSLSLSAYIYICVGFLSLSLSIFLARLSLSLSTQQSLSHTHGGQVEVGRARQEVEQVASELRSVQASHQQVL